MDATDEMVDMLMDVGQENEEVESSQPLSGVQTRRSGPGNILIQGVPKKMKKLPGDTIRRIHSEQVVVDVVSAVKELLENSLDACPTKVEMLLQKTGFSMITVKDNGCGIPDEDRSTCCLPHYTSKIEDFSSLEELTTYGFRGEALSSLCNLSSEVKIMTRTANEVNASSMSYDRTGQMIKKEDNVSQPVGTTVIVKNIFENFPVRLEALKKKQKSIEKKLFHIILQYFLIHPQVHLLCQDPPKLKLEKKQLNSVADAIIDLLGPLVFENLQEFKIARDDSPLKISGYLPTPNADTHQIFRASNDRFFLYVNQRPIDHEKVSKLVNQHIRRHFGEFENKKRYPFAFIHIEVAPNELDVNYTPDKRKLSFHKESLLLTHLEEYLISIYPQVQKTFQPLNTINNINVASSTSMDVDGIQSTQLYQNKTQPSSHKSQATQFHSSKSTQFENSEENVEEGNLFEEGDVDSAHNEFVTANQTLGGLPKPNFVSKSFSSSSNSTPGHQTQITSFASPDGKRKRDQMEGELTSSVSSSTSPMSHQQNMLAKIDLHTIKQKLSTSPKPPFPTAKIIIDPNQRAPSTIKKEELSEVMVIGRCNKELNSLFICRLHKYLYVFDQYKAEESLIFYGLRCSQELSREPLQTPIKITESMVGGKKNYLLLLDTGYDKIIQLNGVELLRQVVDGNQFSIAISGLSKAIPNYGVSDLADLLSLLSKLQDPVISPGEPVPRPPSVLKHLLEKATMQSESLSPVLTNADGKEIINKLIKCPARLEQCPHKQPIWYPISECKLP